MVSATDAVLGLVGVVCSRISLQQAAHDAAHGREVVDDQEFQVGGVAHGASSRVAGAGDGRRVHRVGSAAELTGGAVGLPVPLRDRRRSAAGRCRSKRSSASRFITMMLMRRLTGLCGSSRLERRARRQALHAQHACPRAGRRRPARGARRWRGRPTAPSCCSRARRRRRACASVWPSSVSRFGTSASTRADLAQQVAHVGLAPARCRCRTSAGSARRRSGCAGRRASCRAGSASCIAASLRVGGDASPRPSRFSASRRAHLGAALLGLQRLQVASCLRCGLDVAAA